MKEQLERLLTLISTIGLNKAIEEFKKIVQNASDPYERVVLIVLLNAVTQYGLEGLEIAKNAIVDLFSGTSIPDVSLLPLEEASDIWAHVQNSEADHLEDVNKVFAIASMVLGRLFTETIKAVLK